MPNYTIYIHKENQDRWLAIENKSEFINNVLNEKTQELVNYMKNAEVDAMKYGNLPKPPVIPGVSRGFCPHGAGKGLCKIDSCNRKYKNA